MTALQILIKALREMGADGLCIPGGLEEGCGCGLDNLMPCETLGAECRPAKEAMGGREFVLLDTPKPKHAQLDALGYDNTRPEHGCADALGLKRMDEEPAKPVCARCNDTHAMSLDDREVMCTACPLPCDKCRLNGRGPYCAQTPCTCDCHPEEPTK